VSGSFRFNRLAIRRLYISASSRLSKGRGCLSLSELVLPGLTLLSKLAELTSLTTSELLLLLLLLLSASELLLLCGQLLSGLQAWLL